MADSGETSLTMSTMEMNFAIICHGYRDGVTEYDVIVDDDVSFKTSVTRSPSKVKKWIIGIENRNHRRLHRLIVGLDIEWRPNTERGEQNPVAILQLFVGKTCLIYQIQRADINTILTFLKNPNYTFVGVGIENDKQKLFRDYGLEVTKVEDLREMAAYELADPDLKKAGLNKLAEVVLRKNADYGKRLKVRMSDWDNDRLSDAQVLYACLDAYVSFAIGRQLQSWFDYGLKSYDIIGDGLIYIYLYRGGSIRNDVNLRKREDDSLPHFSVTVDVITED
ncbi:hypothetical protein OSB04_009626 [Centaurea solstitialis]|uniref:3'-5' exonuclease domain-containing protein n=1 Tax=Centaurea solstitialis TaxID=347529 RepID=A0AA38TP12_9ASTR|nr:hypothetical protein OSB04_009626 [Centaurea solstitialis]